MSAIQSNVPDTTHQLPARVEVKGILCRVTIVPGPIFVTVGGFTRERHYDVDFSCRRLLLSGRIPPADRRFVLARALVSLNS